MCKIIYNKDIKWLPEFRMEAAILPGRVRTHEIDDVDLTFETPEGLPAHIPILHLSAMYLDNGAKVKGLNIGACAYLTQPLEPPLLVATINALLRMKQAEEKIAEQLHELQRWHNVMLDREDRIIELKREVNELLVRGGETLRYYHHTGRRSRKMKYILRTANADRRHRRLGEWVVTTVGLLLALSGLSATASAEGLTIAVSRTPLSLPFYVAESQGHFAAEGVQVTFTEVIGGNRAMQRLIDNAADLATCSDSVIMFNSFKRDDFAVLASFATSSKDVELIAGKALGYVRPEKLAGKRIGTVLGSASHYFVDSWLIFYGVDSQSIRMVSLQPETMAAALEKGEVDAVAIWNPFIFEILKAMPGAKLLPNPGTYILSFNLIGARKLMGKRDDELVRVLRALLRAERFIQAEPVKAQAILRERLDLKQDFVEWVWPHYLYRVMLEQSLLSTLESQARWARREGHVTASRSPNYLNYIHGWPLRKAQSDRMNIGR